MLTEKLLSVALLSTEWIILVLLLLSVLSLAVIVERVILFRYRAGDPEALEKTIRESLSKGRPLEAEATLRESSTSAARVVSRVWIAVKKDGVPFEEALEIAMSEEKLMLERRVAVLGTLGSNAPYVGLLGTVLGIIHSFHSLATQLQGGPTVILKGISEALVATALGLLVAIPAVVAYNYFVRSIKKILVSSENVVRGLSVLLTR